MYNKLFADIMRFVALILFQLFIVDNIRLGYYIHPVVYILFILLMPYNAQRWQVMLAAFGMGMIIDFFSGTPGLNAAAAVATSYVRHFVIVIMTRKSDLEEKYNPSLVEMGFTWFFTYSSILLCVYNLVYFMLEAFSFKLLNIILLQTLLSTLSSVALILLIMLIFIPKSNLTLNK
ncbi:MAG TPA: hypothetical protein IAD13_04490 [Bacteroidetes bacterium]|nr:hypothetical protein [Candidatus Limimorpha avicola]